MRLLKKLLEKDGSGSITLVPEVREIDVGICFARGLLFCESVVHFVAAGVGGPVAHLQSDMHWRSCARHNDPSYPEGCTPSASSLTRLC
jgi:hypothetical protein